MAVEFRMPITLREGAAFNSSPSFKILRLQRSWKSLWCRHGIGIAQLNCLQDEGQFTTPSLPDIGVREVLGCPWTHKSNIEEMEQGSEHHIILYQERHSETYGGL